jgi:transcriptional regulator with XRE-family HTH domain
MMFFQSNILYIKQFVYYHIHKGIKMSQFSESLKKLRTEQSLSMQLLADKANVSKSMISKIERDEVQPTIDVAGRLAKALGKSLSELLHTMPQVTQIAFIPRDEQAIWVDGSGIKRRNISPVFEGLQVEWLEVELPSGASIRKCSPIKTMTETKYILVKSGELKIIIDEKNFTLKTGDSLFFESNSNHEFHNETDQSIEFYVVMKHENL